MIVVDTNIVVYLKCTAAFTAQARHARDLDPVWIVPTLWRHEFLNALLRIARQQELPLHRALAIWRDTFNGFVAQEYQANMALALRLAMAQQITCYDAQYLALAQEFGVRLLTEDKELLRKFPAVAISLNAFCGGTAPSP
jgi:predicted nucleic acid-binding protein